MCFTLIKLGEIKNLRKVNQLKVTLNQMKHGLFVRILNKRLERKSVRNIEVKNIMEAFFLIALSVFSDFPPS